MTVVVKLADIEGAGRAAPGQFAQRAIGRMPVPGPLARFFALFCVNTIDRVVALTYDDGPHPVHTPAILDVLADRGATATFFVLAKHVELYPEIARRIVAEGHEVGLHGDDHRSLLTMTRAEAVKTLRDAKRRVEAVVEVPVALYRPPYGQYTSQQARGIRRLGMDLIMWSGDALDWLDDAETAIADRVVAAAFGGGITLLHDDRADPETLEPGQKLPAFDRAAVLELALDGLDEAGYRTMTVGAMRAAYQNVRSIARYGRG